MSRLSLVFSLLLAVCATSVQALEFRSVKETGTLFYEAPNTGAKKLFVVSRYYPVEVITRQGEWARVRDAAGGIAWVQLKDLQGARTLLVTADKIAVRKAANATSPVLFSVEKNGVLEWIEEPQSGWVKVKHRDGVEGYAPIESFWGL